MQTKLSLFKLMLVVMELVLSLCKGHPIAFISKELSPRHAAISVYDRELLVIVQAVNKWSQYLLGQRFIIRTDQRTLILWLTKLIKGVENKVVNALPGLSCLLW